MTALLLATFVSLQAARNQPATAATFQPRLTVQGPAVRPLPFTIPLDQRRAARAIARAEADREIICGMVVVRQSPDADAKIVLPARDTGAAVKRIEPRACNSQTKDPGK